MRVSRSVPCLLIGSFAAVRGETFDYLIAGAGTAGLVVANRLSENPAITVGVIEPGDDVRRDPEVTAIDFLFANFNESINWQYPAVSQPELGSRNLTYRAGKAYGGTSTVNGMVYIRGDKAQYDAWEELGNKGWSWNSIFSYYKRGERFFTPSEWQVAKGATYEKDDHGVDGPLPLGFPTIISNSTFYESARTTWGKLGVGPVTDLNGGHTRGFVCAPQTLYPDVSARGDSATAYYGASEKRPNLKVIKGTVKKITWSKDSGKDAVASGFEYITPSGETIKAEARKEVIVSASAYRSPLILESSGIGNQKILKKLGIPVKVDLPGVGENLQDHNIVGMTYSLSSNFTGRIGYATMPTAQDVFGNKTSSVAAASFKQLPVWAKALSAVTEGALSQKAIEKRFKIQHDLIFNKNVTVAELFPTNTGDGHLLEQYWTSMPFSWGRVHLESRDDINKPAITPNIMATEFDVEMLTAVGRLSQKGYSTPPLSDLIADNVSPGYSKLPLDASDGQWATYLKENVLNALHVVGSCAMLPKALGGVVDSETRVHGTRNVRVIDASIIPMQLSGHTMAPVYGVAEKAVDFIKATWN